MKSGCVLFLLTAGSFYCYLCYTVIAPFIPGEIARRGLSPVHNGLIIALLSVNGFYMPAVMQSSIFPRLGFSKSLALGALILGAALSSFGFAYFFENNVVFLVLTYISRFFQGLAGTMVFQSAFAVLGIVFAKNIGRAASIFNIGMTVGLAGGPFLGGVLYSWFGYIGPFFLFGGFTLGYALINILFKVDQGIEDSSLSELDNSVHNETSNLSVKHICCNTKPVLGLIVYYFSLACLCFFEPILADKLSDTFGYTSDQVAYFYARFTVASFFGNLMMIVLSWKYCAYVMACFGFAFSGIGCVFLAPEGFILNTETTTTLLTLGLICLGVGCEILLNTSSALTLDSLNQLFPGRQSSVSKLFAEVRINVASSSFLSAPFLSSLVTQLASYEATCNAAAVILLSLFVFYLLLILIKKPDRVSRKQAKGENDMLEPLLQKT